MTAVKMVKYMKRVEMRETTEAAELNVTMPMTRDCVGDIRAIIAEARRSVVRHVNNTMTLAYWLIGRRLVVEEQKGRRAAYGEYLLRRVSCELTAEFGKGFAEPQLKNCRLFYSAYPNEKAIRYALRIQLSWTHHRAIGQMDTYRRMYDALIKPREDQPTIGILLGTEVDETDVEYSVMSECKRMFATKLLPYMPTKAELQFEIERARCRRICSS